MQRRTIRIRVWFVFAVAAVSLALTSSASAMRSANDQGGAIVNAPTSVATPSGFGWLDAAAVAAVAIAVIVSGVVLTYVARNHNRSRVATSH